MLQAADDDAGLGGSGGGSWVARVEVENECAALREALGFHQQTTAELLRELEEERSASATAAAEAMSMILRVQREKAQLEMEARQYKRFAEEKISHDQSEIKALEELLYKRGQLAQALHCEVEGYKHRLLGLGDDSVLVADEVFDDMPGRSFEYPSLKCDTPSYYMLDLPDNNSEKSILEDSFCDWEPLENLELRIEQLERKPSGNSRNGKGKRVDKSRQTSINSPRSLSGMVPTVSPRIECKEYGNRNGSMKLVDSSEQGDVMNDRVYTVDSIQGVSCNGNGLNGFNGHGRQEGSLPRVNVGYADVAKLCARLQALEADKESMRQTLISMSLENAQIILLKEIAQHLCKDMASEGRLVVKKPSSSRVFSFVALVKWFLSYLCSRKEAPCDKPIFQQTDNCIGLPLLIQKSAHMKQLRCLSRYSRI